MLSNYRQFVVWIAVPSRTRPGKTDKMPINPLTGRAADHGDPQVRLSRSEAEAYVAMGIGAGIGFVFTEADPFFFLDLDDARTETGWSQLATQLCQQYAGCYVEVSYSGKGLHIIGSTTPLTHGTRNQTYGLELYTKNRFVALTGYGAQGDACKLVNLTPLLALPGWSGGTVAAADDANWTDGPCPGYGGPADDLDLIAKMLASKPSVRSAFGSAISLQDLWAGNHAGDASAADMALCSHLAFWTGKDCERMDRLMRQSGLCRDKWLDREDYRRWTILKAVGSCERVYGRPEPVAAPAPPSEGEWRTGHQLMTVPMQVEHFKGCVYIRDEHRILVPDGGLLKPDQFRAVYGGFNFALDMSGQKTTKSAWEAFTESQGYSYPWAHDVCFRPECPPAAVIAEEGLRLVNTFVPVPVERRAGDAEPYLRHLRLLLPDPHDRAILTAYMAAVVQHPGVKFQWAPLIQGAEGNGKTLLFSCLAAAVGRRYTHFPNANDLGNKFNAWLLGKLFIGIEEVYVADRQELVETLKPLITNDRVEVQGKGANQTTADNRANFMLSSNHRDAVRKNENDRRYAIFYTAQQSAQDMARDGMTGNYFPELYRWLRLGGYAVVTEYLCSYQIPDELNPAVNCHRAPRTSSTDAAIACSLGTIEQEVQEAIDSGRPGFCGGWISSLALDKLLEDRRLSGKMPRARRRDMLLQMGYDYHPALPKGRVHNPIAAEGGRPCLYIKAGHLAGNLSTVNDVVRRYTEAQMEKPAGVAGSLFGGAVGGG